MNRPVLDTQKAFLIRLLRTHAHLCSVAEAPRVSLDAVALNECADRLIANDSMPQSEFEKPDALLTRK